MGSHVPGVDVDLVVTFEEKRPSCISASFSRELLILCIKIA